MAQSSWRLNAEDPRAPSEAEWARMTAAERALVRASLPSAVPLELHPPEGHAHRKPKERARDALEEVAKLHAMVAELVTARDEAVRRAEQEARKAEQESQRAEQEARKAEQEAQKADDLARELAVARAEIERLRKK